MADDGPMTLAGGPTRRRRRISDEETAQRMLDSAVAMVNSSGLTVSLEHISLEDVIRDSGVSRSAAYRRWPYKDLFVGDLLRTLANAAVPAMVGTQGGTALVQEIVSGHADELRTADGRQWVWSELLRRGAWHDFDAIHRSTEWRTYLALHATFDSLADGELRDEIQRALAESEQGFVERIAAVYQRIAVLLGYRLRPGSEVGFRTVATLANATMRGLVITALSTPETATERLRADPLGTGRTADWSLPGLAIASVITGQVEVDPTVVWSDDRIASVVAALG
jgi:AcrR family transcriptional regulator